MNYRKNRLFVFDIETVIDVESSRSFLKLGNSVSKEDVLKQIKKYHMENSFAGSDFVKPPFHKIVAISYLDATIYTDAEEKEEYQILNIKSCILTMQVYLCILTMQVYLTCIISSKEVALLWKTEEVTPNKITDTKSGHLV